MLRESRIRRSSMRSLGNVHRTLMFTWRNSGKTSLKAVSIKDTVEGRSELVADIPADGLTKLFQEIRAKKTIEELSPEYQKFAEWLRIE